MNHEALWLIAIVPPPDIAQRIDEARKEFAVNYDCVRGLKPPVHLTLYEPVKLMDADMEGQIAHLRHWAAMQSSFRLELRNFNFFDNPKHPVLYIDVVANADLKELRTGITREVKKCFSLEGQSSKTFRPHFTIGYQDIPAAAFPQVKQAYSKRTFRAVFKVDQIRVFRHNRRNWVPCYDLPLASLETMQGNLW